MTLSRASVLPRLCRSMVLAALLALVPLGLTIIVSHLGLLFWEMRFVSASLAFPGLKPGPHSETKEPPA